MLPQKSTLKIHKIAEGTINYKTPQFCSFPLGDITRITTGEEFWQFFFVSIDDKLKDIRGPQVLCYSYIYVINMSSVYNSNYCKRR